METYSIGDVTADLGQLLELTDLVVPSSDNFWMDKTLKERFVHKMDASDEGREIAIFQDPMPRGDYYFFNPFSESLGKKSPAVTLFYRMVRINLNLSIRTVMLYLIKSILESKEAAESKTEYRMSAPLLRMSTGIVEKRTTIYDLVDAKMMDEFEKICDRIDNEFVHLPYMANTMTAKVTCDLLDDPTWDEKFGKDIRKKSLLAFKQAFMGVLGITSPEGLAQFSVKYDPSLKTSARLYTTMTMVLKLYTQFNDVLAYAYGKDGVPNEGAVINLGALSEVIDRFPMAFAIAKHMTQPVLPKVGATDLGTADTGSLRMGSATLTGQKSRFPGPEVIDSTGRRTRGGGGGNTSLQLARAPEPTGRFRPHVLNESPADPFAPVTKPLGGGSSAFGSMGGVMASTGYFGGGSSGFGGGGLDLRPPSNYNSPQTRSTFF